MSGIVVGFDGTEEAYDALELAERLRSATGKELILAVVDENAPPPSDAGGYWEYQQNYFAEMGRKAVEHLGHREISRRTASDSAPAALQQIAEAEDADVIVLGSTHRGQVGRVLAGSVGERLLAGAPCSIAIAPKGFADASHPSLGIIGVGSDGGEESQLALATAADLTRGSDSSLRLIGVAGEHDAHMEAELAGALERCRGVPAERKLVVGEPAAALVDQGVELDLLVIGSRDYGPVRSVLLGGVSREVMRIAPCPVIVVPRSAATREAGIVSADAEVNSGLAD
jgi:nucleotide-binding universal stress UspA family protein